MQTAHTRTLGDPVPLKQSTRQKNISFSFPEERPREGYNSNIKNVYLRFSELLNLCFECERRASAVKLKIKTCPFWSRSSSYRARKLKRIYAERNKQIFNILKNVRRGSGNISNFSRYSSNIPKYGRESRNKPKFSRESQNNPNLLAKVETKRLLVDKFET